MLRSFLPYATVVAAAACFATATILQCIGSRRAGEQGVISVRLLVQLGRSPAFVAGLALDTLGSAFTVAAVGTLPLFLVQAVSASSVGLTALLARLVLRERLSGPALACLAALVVGLTLLAPAAEPSEVAPVAVAVQLVSLIGLPLVVVAARRVRRAGASSAALLGALAGTALAASSIGARVLPHDGDLRFLITQPLAWGVAGFTALGMVVFSVGLQQGSAVRVSAACMAAEVLLPGAVGVLVLGDHARPGAGMAAVVGFTLTVAAALGLALRSDRTTTGPQAPAPILVLVDPDPPPRPLRSARVLAASSA